MDQLAVAVLVCFVGMVAQSAGAAPAPVLEINVSAAGVSRLDHPVEVDLTSEQCTSLSAEQGISVREAGSTTAVPSQVEAAEDGSARLTFIMPGETAADAERRFQVFPSPAADGPEPVVKAEDGIEHQGQTSFRITTPAGTYIYHKPGAGFASLFDPEGNDWLSYRPTGGSAGNYRGIPNLVYPEGHFHPGNPDGVSRLVANGPARVTIESETTNGEWACRWDIYPRFAKLTVLKVAHPYWFLYEGTPGGKLDLEEDWVVRSDGFRAAASESWGTELASPQWVVFGDGATGRALFVACHQTDTANDSYWPMEGNMTVFGFGRKGLHKHLEEVPATFTVGLIEPDAKDEARLQAAVLSTMQPVQVSVEEAR